MDESQVSGRVQAAQSTKQGTTPNHDNFPVSGNVRPAQAAKFLSIGLSSLWLFIKQGRIQRPMKFSSRISTFEATYIRSLAKNGIPSLDEVKAGESQKEVSQ